MNAFIDTPEQIKLAKDIELHNYKVMQEIRPYVMQALEEESDRYLENASALDALHKLSRERCEVFSLAYESASDLNIL